MIILIGFLCHFSLISTSKAFLITTWSSDFRPHGGYVDEIMFHVYSEIEVPLAMVNLQTGEIDAYDDRVIQDYLAACVRDPNIEVKFTPSMRYHALTINCERFPTNITAFRRAMAFGFDKYRSNVECNGGMGQPIDSYIPLIATDWEVESTLTEHFYEADFVSGNASLENAGFKDLDGDGWREYDVNDNDIWDLGIDFDDDGYINGSIMEVYAINSSDPAVRACDILVDGLEEMGVRVNNIEIDYDHFFDDVFAGNHWVVYQRENVPIVNPVKILYDHFRSGAQWNREPTNLYHFKNNTIDAILDSMVAANSVEQVKQYAREASLLLAFEQPQIGVYNDINIGAYRNDEFEGFFETKGIGYTDGDNWAVATKIHLQNHLGGPFGGIFDYSLSGDMGTWNPYLRNTKYEATVFQYIYETLWNFDPFTWDPIPGLAYDWDIVQTTANRDILDGQKFTFYLYENETWHDGTRFTAADVNHSIYMWRDSPYHNPEMWDIYKIEMPNGVEGNVIELFVNMTGFFEWADTTLFYITPAHIWNGVTNVSAVDPSYNRIIGTGPYAMASHVPGEYIRLERHEDWRWDISEVDGLYTDTFSTSNPDPIITYTANGPSVISTYTSLSSSDSNILPDLSPVLQFLEYGAVLFFIVTLVVILRRKQVK